MATYGQTLRRGLPRRPGGDPWPPAGDAPVGARDGDADAGGEAAPATVDAAAAAAPVAASASSETAAVTEAPAASEAPVAEAAEVPAASASAAPAASAPVAATPARALRRGLPRVAGGEPWPPADAAGPAAPAAQASADTAASAAATPAASTGAPAPATSAAAPAASAAAPAAATPATSAAPAPADPAAAPAASATAAGGGSTVAVRRGLPRTPGGEPWPPADFTAVPVAAAEPVGAAGPAAAIAPDASAQPAARPVAAASGDDIVVEADEVSAETVLVPAAAADVSTPLPFTRTVFPGAAARAPFTPPPEPKRIGPFTRLQWAGATVVGGITLLLLAGMAVAAVRFILSTPPLQDFLAAYPGEYHLPEGAPVGLPAWLGWQHFFNVFLMVLIIRSGLQVRTEKRPTAFWSPRTNKKRKISLALWFHQSLDILWIVNGVVFVVLLFVTGQWMRIIPTSWEVFPNALSAALQYVSLDWPTENGWVNYNSLQQLAYFATVFLAAPLAIITGVRMSGVWPKDAKTLNRIYPVEWARAVHFPTMIYFVVFIFFHVVLVFATGALRNLNHMYAAQGSVDPNAYADNWVGFWIFVGSMFVIAAAWVAARPLVLAPIARLFGSVSSR